MNFVTFLINFIGILPLTFNLICKLMLYKGKINQEEYRKNLYKNANFAMFSIVLCWVFNEYITIPVNILALNEYINFRGEE